MRHKREDYNGRIVDLQGIIPEDEPVFLLRGKDPHAAKAVAYYAQLLAEAGADEDMVEASMEQSTLMDLWPHGKDRPFADMPAEEAIDYTI